MYKKLFLNILSLVLITSRLSGNTTIPKITLIFVVDQLSYQTFKRLSPNFKYGFKTLLENGINFTNAHHPHGNPVTSTGHATIGTGAYAKDHGIVLNSWLDEDGKVVNFDSAHHLLVETLSDKLILAQNPHQSFFVYALANKPEPAIAMAGKLGKAIWFDDNAKRYTSSKTYYSKLPSWLEQFNQINNNLGNKTFFDLCKTCINLNNIEAPESHLVLWIGVSDLDILGHIYGQASPEATNLLYRLDKQIGDLINYTQHKAGRKQTLIVLTADHGCSPIPEKIKAQGFYAARRLNANKLIDTANQLIAKNHGIKNIITKIESTQLFFNKKIMRTLKHSERNLITSTLQDFIKNQPGIKHCWTKQELETSTFDPYNLEQYYKNQLHAQRSGDLILMPYPYTYITTYPGGTGHTSAYAYDTQVPLILYQKGSLEKKQINKGVRTTQLAPTLAGILNIPCPSGALGAPLPT